MRSRQRAVGRRCSAAHARKGCRRDRVVRMRAPVVTFGDGALDSGFADARSSAGWFYSVRSKGGVNGGMSACTGVITADRIRRNSRAGSASSLRQRSSDINTIPPTLRPRGLGVQDTAGGKIRQACAAHALHRCPRRADLGRNVRHGIVVKALLLRPDGFRKSASIPVPTRSNRFLDCSRTRCPWRRAVAGSVPAVGASFSAARCRASKGRARTAGTP